MDISPFRIWAQRVPICRKAYFACIITKACPTPCPCENWLITRKSWPCNVYIPCHGGIEAENWKLSTQYVTLGLSHSRPSRFRQSLVQSEFGAMLRLWWYSFDSGVFYLPQPVGGNATPPFVPGFHRYSPALRPFSLLRNWILPNRIAEWQQPQISTEDNRRPAGCETEEMSADDDKDKWPWQWNNQLA